jgi:adenylate cyclase
MAAHNGLGTVLSYHGELVAARAHLEQSIALYDPQKHSFRVFFYGTNLRVDSLAHLAHVLWLLGYPEQALRRGRDALTLAQEPFHPFTLAHVSNLAAVVHHFRQEGPLAQAQAEAGIALSGEHGFALELGRGTVLRGWALVVQGQVDRGLAQMHQGLAAYQATGAEAWRPYYLALLAEAYGKVGQLIEGLRLLTEACALADRRGETWWAAELHRLKGELLRQQAVEACMKPAPPQASIADGVAGGVTGGLPPVAEAERCFARALDVARRRQARSLELRAAMSLSRLWQQQGNREAARRLLGEVYGWFREGFDTADLREARTLLDELSARAVSERSHRHL